MLQFTIEPTMRFAEIIKKYFQHLPSERSILNGAYKITGNETEDELQCLALRSVLELQREYEEKGKITGLVDEHIKDFMKLYNVLPHVLQNNIKDQLIDLYGDKFLKYI